MSLEAFLGELASDPSRCAVFTDFDGTVSAVVEDRDAAEPVPGAVERLLELAPLVGRLAVVSGRPVSFLRGFFPDTVELSGLYGIEHWVDGRLIVDDTALEWLPAVRATVEQATDEFGAAVVEDKSYSLTLHYRHDGDPAFGRRVHAWARDRASTTGLEARDAKMSIELHPPIGLTKADAVADMLAGVRAALFAGDDVGDVPAFELLADRYAEGHLRTEARVAVASVETVPLVLDRATDVIDGPGAIIGLLDSMLAAAGDAS